MRSDFVATISRHRSNSIDSETHESQLEALKDLFGGWNDSRDEGYDTIGVALTDELDPDASDTVLVQMLQGMDNEWLIERLKAAGIDLDELKKELS